MIPILFDAGTKDFSTNGLGRLKDAQSCSVTEERNGTYELSMVYPISGIHYSDIAIDRIVYATPADGKSAQPFRIYKITRPINGSVEISAEHISYLLSAAVLLPFSASTCSSALAYMPNYMVGADGFSFWTDKDTNGTFVVEAPTAVRSMLGGTTGSILDVYGGEYEFDKFTVKLHSARGADNGVTIRYGKNLQDINYKLDMSNVYTGIIPYVKDSTSESIITLDEKVIKSEHTGDFAQPHYKAVDFSSEFETDEEVTQDALRKKAQSYVKLNEGWEVSQNLDIEFVGLWQTDQYKDMAIQRVNLCDTVHVVYTDLGVNVDAKVIKTDYDVLAERYNSIEVGNSTTNLAKTIGDAINDATQNIDDTVNSFPAIWKKAIADATAQITGGLGGYIVLNCNADGWPEELLIMDSPNKETAVNVWRWNKGGLGHSHNGYDGPFDDIAITQDGKINASMITTGDLTANIIKAGVLQDLKGNISWNLESGAMTAKNLSITAPNFKLTNGGLIQSGSDSGKHITIYDGVITGYNGSAQQAALEIADGAFNIVGNLRINGREGVSGSLHSVRDVTSKDHKLVDRAWVSATGSATYLTGGSITDGKYISGGSVHASTTTITYVSNATYGWTSTATVVTSVTYSSPSLAGSISFRGNTATASFPTGLNYSTVNVSEVSVSTTAHEYAYGLMMS